MLRREQEVCVVHVAAVRDRSALETLCHTTQVIDALGVAQVLVLLDQGGGTDLIWSAAPAAEVRPLRCSGLSIVAKIGALQLEFSKLSLERKLYAVHLHGVGPCLLGSQALKGTSLQVLEKYFEGTKSRSGHPWSGVRSCPFHA